MQISDCSCTKYSGIFSYQLRTSKLAEEVFITRLLSGLSVGMQEKAHSALCLCGDECTAVNDKHTVETVLQRKVRKTVKKTLKSTDMCSCYELKVKYASAPCEVFDFKAQHHVE